MTPMTVAGFAFTLVSPFLVPGIVLGLFAIIRNFTSIFDGAVRR